MKFRTKQGVEVEAQRSGQHMIIAVNDPYNPHGEAMDLEVFDRIFEPVPEPESEVDEARRKLLTVLETAALYSDGRDRGVFRELKRYFEAIDATIDRLRRP